MRVKTLASSLPITSVWQSSALEYSTTNSKALLHGIINRCQNGLVVKEPLNKKPSFIKWAELRPGHPIIQSLRCFMLGWYACYHNEQSENPDQLVVLPA